MLYLRTLCLAKLHLQAYSASVMDLSYSHYHALAGGILIGLASFLATWATGKIPGISGVFSRAFMPASADRFWRVTFLVGLVAGAAIAFQSVSSATNYQPVTSTMIHAIAGLLVGFGTRLGGGCTSGHGICGIGLGARDSLVGTINFMVFGILTVYITRHILS